MNIEHSEFLVSVVTPSFNSEKEILSCYESLKNQTFLRWEWLVTDDGSTDSTPKILNELALQDERVRPEINLRNLGPGPCRNASLDRSRGQLVAFLDSDDLWRVDKLEAQVEFHQNTGARFSFTSFIAFRDSCKAKRKLIDAGPEREFSYEDMLSKRATFGCSTVMLDASLIGDKRMPNLRSGQDYAFWLSILKDGHSATLYPKPLTYYRIRAGSVSRNKFKKAIRQWQIYRQVEGLSFLLSFRYFILYAKHALTR